MATLTIGDRSVQVGDEFLKLDPAQQSAAVEEIAQSLGIKSAPEAENSLAGSAKALGAGAVEGAIGLAGLPLDAAGLAARGVDYLSGGSQLQDSVAPFVEKLGSRGLKTKFEQKFGELPKPQTQTEKYLNTIGSFGPAVLAGPGGVGRRLLTNVVAPGVASEAAGQLAEGTGYEPVARVAAALGGAAVTGKIANAMTATKGLPALPTAEQNAAFKTAKYNDPAVDALQIVPVYGDRVADAILGNFQKQRFSAKNADVSEVMDLVNGLRRPEFSTNFRLADFDATRRRLSEVAARGGTGEKAATQAIRSIDAATLRVPQRFVAAGDAAAAGKALFEGRKAAAVGFRSDKVQKFIDDALVDAQSTYSGGNLENLIYQKIRTALKNPGKELRGWNEREVNALRDTLPGHGRGALRRVGKLLGGGGGLGQLASGGAGAAMFGPAGLVALPALGLAANKLGSSIAMSKLKGVQQELLSRSPIYASSAPARTAALSGGVLAGLPRPAEQLLLGLLAAR